jgi:chloramphenicol-sensitive protein RarD
MSVGSRGVGCAIGACVVWGVFPVYWKQLVHVTSLQVIGHRFVWSFLLMVVIVLVSGRAREFRDALTGSWRSAVFPITGFLIGLNWYTFIWAVESDVIVEASLGYFITPLVNVGLGVVVLRETLRPAQWLAVGLALAGVIYLTIVYGAIPIIALTLAFSFGVYGLLKKTALLGATHSLTAETAAMFVPATVYLVWAESTGDGSFAHSGTLTDVLLLSTGPVTVVPLLLFGWAVQRIRLSLMGLVQYIAPTLQFVVGVAIYHEPFTSQQLIGYSLVWIALVVLTVEGMMTHRLRMAARTG